jgi:hypothetical protein
MPRLTADQTRRVAEFLDALADLTGTTGVAICHHERVTIEVDADPDTQIKFAEFRVPMPDTDGGVEVTYPLSVDAY